MMKSTNLFIIGIELKREYLPKKFLKEGELCMGVIDDKHTIVFDEPFATHKTMFIRDNACHDITSASHPDCIMHGKFSPFTFDPLEAHKFHTVDDAIRWYKNNWNIIWLDGCHINRKWFTLHTLQVDEIYIYEEDGKIIDCTWEKAKNFVG